MTQVGACGTTRGKAPGIYVRVHEKFAFRAQDTRNKKHALPHNSVCNCDGAVKSIHTG
jgi:hypothetical protein